MGKPFDPEYWQKKVEGYQAQEWSDRPSPFAMTAVEYFPPHAAILELGAGAGQDGLWFAKDGYDITEADGTDAAFGSILQKAEERGLKNVRADKFDLAGTFPFTDGCFGVVYAQLVLHYFNDETMHHVMDEIRRVLKPGGVLACMVNSTDDEEYDENALNPEGLIETKGITKRFFTLGTFEPFISGFETKLFDTEGTTPKDDAVDNTGLIRFIGIKR
jgi:SAM-dependent methyltransferase